MKAEIVMRRHGEEGFWPLAGPFALDKAVHKDLGEPLSSAPGMAWWFALADGVPVGFCTLRETEDSCWLDYHYTLPAHRKKGVQGKLAKERSKHLAGLPAKPLRISCRSHHWASWEKQGFKLADRRGDWVFGVKGESEKAKAKAKAKPKKEKDP